MSLNVKFNEGNQIPFKAQYQNKNMFYMIFPIKENKQLVSQIKKTLESMEVYFFELP